MRSDLGKITTLTAPNNAPQAAHTEKAEAEAAYRAEVEATAAAAREREGDLARRLDDAEARVTEMQQWEEAEAAWAREMEAATRREEGLGAATRDAETAREAAELRAEEALAELERRDGERQVRLSCAWFAKRVCCPLAVCFVFGSMATTTISDFLRARVTSQVHVLCCSLDAGVEEWRRLGGDEGSFGSWRHVIVFVYL